MTIAEYLATVKERLVNDPLIASFHIRRERSTTKDGHLRVQAILADGSQLEFSEYVQVTARNEIATITYSYHWADAQGTLIRRWDNTPHFPGLPGYPDHIHDGIANQVLPGQPMSISAVLDEIARSAA